MSDATTERARIIEILTVHARGLHAKAEREQIRVCENCRRGRATCLGAYEDATTPSYACDDCCAHGCEDGHCEQLYERDDDSTVCFDRPVRR